MFDFSFTQQQLSLQKNIIEFAQNNLNDDLIRRDQTQDFDRSLWKKCASLNLHGLPVSSKWGGNDSDALSTIIALEGLGYGCRDNGLTFALGAQLLSVTIPIWLHGNDKQREKYLPKFINGQNIGANAITEKQSGSDVYTMETTGINKGGKWMLNGTKTYCTNAPIADIVLAYVLTDPTKGALGGISAFILEKSKGHFESSPFFDKMGLRTVLMGEVYLKDVEVDNHHLLGKEGAGMVLFTQSMIWERIGLSALHLGTMRRILEEVIEFAKKRIIFGNPISKYQAISHTLAEFKADIEALRLLVYQAAWKLDQGRNAMLEASIVKLKVSESYKHYTQKVLQIYGTHGYINHHEAERMFRDASASTLYSGSSEIQKNIIAKYMKL